MLKSPNPLRMYELGDANIHHTRLRLGLSHLKSHLFTYNLIDREGVQKSIHSVPLLKWVLVV